MRFLLLALLAALCAAQTAGKVAAKAHAPGKGGAKTVAKSPPAAPSADRAVSSAASGAVSAASMIHGSHNEATHASDKDVTPVASNDDSSSGASSVVSAADSPTPDVVVGSGDGESANVVRAAAADVDNASQKLKDATKDASKKSEGDLRQQVQEFQNLESQREVAGRAYRAAEVKAVTAAENLSRNTLKHLETANAANEAALNKMLGVSKAATANVAAEAARVDKEKEDADKAAKKALAETKDEAGKVAKAQTDAANKVSEVKADVEATKQALKLANEKAGKCEAERIEDKKEYTKRVTDLETKTTNEITKKNTELEEGIKEARLDTEKAEKEKCQRHLSQADQAHTAQCNTDIENAIQSTKTEWKGTVKQVEEKCKVEKDTLKGDKTSLQGSIDTINKNLQEKITETEQCSARFQSADTELKAIRKSVDSCNQQKTDMQGKFEASTREVKDVKEKLGTSHGEVQRLTAEVKQLRSENNKYTQLGQTLQDNLRSFVPSGTNSVQESSLNSADPLLDEESVAVANDASSNAMTLCLIGTNIVSAAIAFVYYRENKRMQYLKVGFLEV